MDGQYPGGKDGGDSTRHAEMGELDIREAVAIDVHLHAQGHYMNLFERSMPKGIEEMGAFVDAVIGQDSYKSSKVLFRSFHLG